jgi:hypothetical protein
VLQVLLGVNCSNRPYSTSARRDLNKTLVCNRDLAVTIRTVIKIQ